MSDYNIGEAIRKYRRANGFTQEAISGALNISVGTLANYENNVSSPNLETLDKLATLFGISINEVVGMQELKQPEDSELAEYGIDI